MPNRNSTFLCTEVSGQHGEAQPQFEVASIKRSDEGRDYWPTGGPGTKEPTTLRCHSFLGTFLMQAFDLKLLSEMETPNWVWQRPMFLLTAKVAPDATREQIPLMFQSLLKERFHLAYHVEKRELSGYRMVVAKNGPKLKKSADDAEGADEHTIPTKMEKDGFPNTPGQWNLSYGSKYWMKKQTLSQIATFMGRNSGGKPVVDATGLTGQYDITLYWDPGVRVDTADSESAPVTPGTGQPFLGAVQSQLGLKLEPTKVTLNVFVIDHIDKAPTEN
jgi:bla regulator protein blaR1